MNETHTRAIQDLVADYEAMSDQGSVAFLQERAYERLIEYYEQEEQIDRALEVVEHALVQYAYTIDFHLKKAQLLICDNRAEEALTSLEQATIFSPSEPEILLLRAEAYIPLGRMDDALDILEELKPEASGELLSDIFFIEALIFEQQELHESMYFSLVASLRENPVNRDALERIWMAIELCRRHEEADVIFEQILEVDAYASLAWHNLGHIRAYQGRYAEAIECYEYAYLSDDRFEQACRDCAELCFELKLYHRALRHYEELLEHFEAESEVLMRMGQCQLELGNVKMARTFFTEALQLDPLEDEILYYLGQCYAKEELWLKAVRFYQRAISIEENREEYYAALGEAFFRLGKLDKAETNFELAIDAAPEESRYWIRYMCFLLETGRGEDALDCIEEAEEVATGSELLYGRVACLIALGRRQEAFYWLGEALLEDFDAHRSLFEILPDLERDPEVISLITTYMH